MAESAPQPPPEGPSRLPNARTNALRSARSRGRATPAWRSTTAESARKRGRAGTRPEPAGRSRFRGRAARRIAEQQRFGELPSSACRRPTSISMSARVAISSACRRWPSRSAMILPRRCRSAATAGDFGGFTLDPAGRPGHRRAAGCRGVRPTVPCREPARLPRYGEASPARSSSYSASSRLAPAQTARRLVERRLPAGEGRLEVGWRRLRQNSRRRT